MRTTFKKLVTEFSEEIGCRYECKDGACQATLTVEDFSFQLALAEEAGMLFIQTGVGILPVHDREPLLLALLSANNLFSETYGMTLGLDREQDLITLQVGWSMDNLDHDSFAAIMGNMARAAEQWLKNIYTGEYNQAESGKTETPGTPEQNLIRV